MSANLPWRLRKRANSYSTRSQPVSHLLSIASSIGTAVPGKGKLVSAKLDDLDEYNDLDGGDDLAEGEVSRVGRLRVFFICSLLLLASAINYLDRQTLSSASSRILEELDLTKEQYGDIEGLFGYGFVLGSIVFGILADWVSIRWLYPAVLVAWSAATAATAYATDYQDLLWLRFSLGLFEAGHWPCGVRVVRQLTRVSGRTMGNGLLQSGTSIGAILAPLVMLALLTDEVGSWRTAFLIVGAVGIFWVCAWFATVRPGDLTYESRRDRQQTPWSVFFSRRLLIVLVVVCLINTTWQVLRAWLHLFLNEGRGYSEQQTLLFNSAWFVATDVGCLSVGLFVLWLCARGFTATRARQVMFTGLAGVTAWFLVPPAQKFFGRLVDATGSYDVGLAAAAVLPAAAAVVLWIFWGKESNAPTE